MSENSNKPTPAELCLIAKEIFGAEDLKMANEQTDAILEKAMNLWVRASRFADRAPDEVKKLDVELRKRNSSAEDVALADQKRADEAKTLGEIAAKHFRHVDGRRLTSTIKKFVEACGSDNFRLVAALKADKFDGNQEILVVEQHRESLALAGHLRKKTWAENNQKKAQSSPKRK
jgi:hypothetical protein